jgi:hypothetical protein
LLARPDIDAVMIATGERWHPLMQEFNSFSPIWTPTPGPA